MREIQPRVPGGLHPLAREVLEALRGKPEAASIVLGGGVALQHYCEFRGTVDLDAWWSATPRPETERAIRAAMEEVAGRHGSGFDVRAWGETRSYELRKGRKKIFSFQVSLRCAELDPPFESAWPPVRIESFRDNLGSKMNAVVNRGAPRDFLDVHEVCRSGLASVAECWATWALKNPGRGAGEARLLVLHHLEALEARRPLRTIAREEERQAARGVREWIRTSLCAQGIG